MTSLLKSLLKDQHLQQGAIRLAGIAGGARRNEVLNGMDSTARDRVHVIHRDLSHRLQAVRAVSVESGDAILPVSECESLGFNPMFQRGPSSLEDDGAALTRPGAVPGRVVLALLSPVAGAVRPNGIRVLCSPLASLFKPLIAVTSLRGAVGDLVLLWVPRVTLASAISRGFSCAIQVLSTPAGRLGIDLLAMPLIVRAAVRLPALLAVGTQAVVASLVSREAVKRLHLAALRAVLLSSGRATLILHREPPTRGAAPGDGDYIARASCVNFTTYQMSEVCA